MSWSESEGPDYRQDRHSNIAVVITPQAKDIGDFEVRRALPSVQQQMVGPFIFFDQMGPVTFQQGQAMDVRPHPHIGLSTITWLFEGEIEHKDSLGFHQVIRSGEVNWMTAGKGIVHSERSPVSQRDAGARLSGIQAWLALPLEKEKMAPAFTHYPADQVPRQNKDGVTICLIAGKGWGMDSPVKVESETFYAELRMEAESSIEIPGHVEQKAIYICDGGLIVDDKLFEAGTMIVLKHAKAPLVKAQQDTLCMVLGGAPLEGDRHLYWNFVASSKELIATAKQNWKEGSFPSIEGEDEFIPLPEE